MPGQQFRMKTPTMALTPGDEKIPVTIPEGATVQVADADLTGTKLVEVHWEGERVMMFAIDLRKRAEIVSE